MERVVSEQKGDQAAGVIRVPDEQLKVGVGSTTWWLRALIVQKCSAGVVPPDWSVSHSNL